jgi:hypothetical protein
LLEAWLIIKGATFDNTYVFSRLVSAIEAEYVADPGKPTSSVEGKFKFSNQR